MVTLFQSQVRQCTLRTRRRQEQLSRGRGVDSREEEEEEFERRIMACLEPRKECDMLGRVPGRDAF